VERAKPGSSGLVWFNGLVVSQHAGGQAYFVGTVSVGSTGAIVA
jgi:hypothetical protein